MGSQPEAGSVRLEHGAWPLSLPRVMATDTVTCNRCHSQHQVEILAAADWWDHQALDTQRDHSQGIPCPDCGQRVDLPVPLIQHRDLDAVELLVALPTTTTAERDTAWIRQIVALLSSYISSPSVVTVRASWWGALSRVALGPMLTGLIPVPDLPESREEVQAFLAATRTALELPDVLGALSDFVSAATIEQARTVFENQGALADLRWQSTVEAASRRLLAVQDSDEQRQVVAQRLSHLRQMRVNLEPDRSGQSLTQAAQAAVDAALTLPIDHSDRVSLLQEAVDALRIDGHSRMLGAAMTSLLASKMAAPQRSLPQWNHLFELAEDAIATCRQAFGDEHEATISNVLNLLLLRAEHPAATAEDIGMVCQQYELMARSEAVRRTGLLVAVLNNLASALDMRNDLSRGERLEQTLTLFESVAHITELTDPNDTRTRILALANQAAVLRQRLVGSRLRNLERGWLLLAQAEELAREERTLHPPERVQLLASKLNLAYSMYQVAHRPEQSERVLEALREAVKALAILDEDNAIGITTLINAGSVLVDLYVESTRAGRPQPLLLEEAEGVLTSAADRCLRLFPPGQRTRLTAQLNLAAVFGAPVGSGVKDAARAADLYRQVAAEARLHSLDHVATAMTNLGTLSVGQGLWEDAAAAYAAARHARTQLVRQTKSRHTRLGEVIASGDLAAREALAHVRLNRLDDAVFALEESRATLLRHRLKIESQFDAPTRPGRVIVHLASCTLGTIALVHPHGRPRTAAYGSQPSTAIRSTLASLLNAHTRVERIFAFEHVASRLRDLIDAVTSLIPDDTTEICLVACGPLAGAPLHALPNSDGLTWLDRWQVRYWPSASVASHIPEPDVSRIQRVLAVSSLRDDLPLAQAEADALAAWRPNVSWPPEAWSIAAWLRGRLPHVQLAHFACHARADLVNPTGSRFEVSPDESVTVDQLLEGPELEELQLVIASACQSGAPAADAPDELLGIAYGLVHAGARGAITSLWELNDLPAALLIARLYHELAQDVHPAAALRAAQQWLARVSNADLVRLCQEATGEDSWLPSAIADSLRENVRAAAADDLPFSHGSDWGTFTYLGT